MKIKLHIKVLVSNTAILGRKFNKADLRCAPDFSACAPKNFSQGYSAPIKKVSLEPCGAISEYTVFKLQ